MDNKTICFNCVNRSKCSPNEKMATAIYGTCGDHKKKEEK
jgi:hypothetical protein